MNVLDILIRFDRGEYKEPICVQIDKEGNTFIKGTLSADEMHTVNEIVKAVKP